MPNNKFDAKSFNAEAFRYLVNKRIPDLTLNRLKKSRALAGDPEIKTVFTTQNGTAYARVAMKGLLDGEAVNYDGETDITATSTKTFEQGMVVVGRAKAWTEKDFSADITGGVDFMGNISSQVAEYKDTLDQKTLLAILKGVFAMSTGNKNKEFVEKHTTKISGNMSATTLNSAINKACGANKHKFTLVFMHSDVATNLENLKLLEYMKGTDAEGVQRDLSLATWNGRTVVVDDDLPFVVGYAPATADTEGAVKVVANSATPADGEIKVSDVSPFFGVGEVAAGAYVVSATQYTTFILGDGAITYEDIGAKVAYEMARDPKTNGGVDTLYMRQRKIFSPFGISYEKKSQAKLSPTDGELSDGQNWTLVHSGESTDSQRSYINHKAIPIARIQSLG